MEIGEWERVDWTPINYRTKGRQRRGQGDQRKAGQSSNDFRSDLANPQISMLEVNSAESSVNSAENSAFSLEKEAFSLEKEAFSLQSTVNPTQNRANSAATTVNPAERGRPLLRDTKRKIFERSPRSSFSRSARTMND